MGATVYAETCPHYLTIYREHERALYTKYNPSIQRQQDSELQDIHRALSPVSTTNTTAVRPGTVNLPSLAA